MKTGKKKNQINQVKFTLDTDTIDKHRYKSVDDWWNGHEYKGFTIDNKKISGKVNFKAVVADMGNPDYNFLVLMHAVVEQYLCYRHGITDEQVTEFDTGEGKDLDDPGNSAKAPYHKEHMIANDIESMLSVALGVDWVKYGESITKVLKKWKQKPK